MDIERRRAYDRKRNATPKRKAYMKEYIKEYRKKNKERLDKNRREYYEAHKEHLDNYHKFYEATHREEKKIYSKRYYEKNRQKIIEKLNRREETVYNNIHKKTGKFVMKLGIRPTICPICGGQGRIETHHPSNDRRNKIVFCCKKCHERIHHGFVKNVEVIDLLKF